MTKAAVFDLDGVLLDSMGIWNDLGARYLRSLGVTPEEGLNEILFSMSMEQGAEYLHTHYALPQSAAEVGAGIADMLRDFYFYEVPAKDGAAALLAALTARGVKLRRPRPARGSMSRGRWNGWGCSGISPGFSLRQRSASASMSRQFTCWPPRPCTPRRRKRSSLRTVSTP